MAAGIREGWQYDKPSVTTPKGDVLSVPVPPFITDRGPKDYVRPDALILDDIARRMALDPTLEASDVELTCSDGQVIVSGAVPGLGDKRKIETLLASTFGVADVDIHALKVIGRVVDAANPDALIAESQGTSHAGMLAVEPDGEGPAEQPTQPQQEIDSDGE